MKSVLRAAVACLFLFHGALVCAKTYTIKKGDTLANIARTYYGEPVFGPRGSINKIYKLNPSLKANPSVLEPGQKLTLEDKNQIAAVPVEKEPPHEGVSTHAVIVVTQIAEKSPIKLPEAEPTAPRPPPAPSPEPPHEPLQKAYESAKPTPPVHVEMAHPTHEHPAEPTHNYFSIIASYSMIVQTATENISGTSYTLNSNPSYSIELGWDHWWNESFSTVLTYSIMQLSSKEHSDVTGSPVVDTWFLSQAELALMNRVAKPVRLGLGIAYGDHLFLENFSATPSNPSIYRFAFWNPFVAAELTPYESEQFEFIINLKVAALPAQVGQGHDLRSGTEYFGQVSLMQKFENWALLYGVSYSTEDQTRTDATETRSEWAVKIGALF